MELCRLLNYYWNLLNRCICYKIVLQIIIVSKNVDNINLKNYMDNYG